MFCKEICALIRPSMIQCWVVYCLVVTISPCQLSSCLTNFQQVLLFLLSSTLGVWDAIVKNAPCEISSIWLKSGQARGYEGRPDFSGLVTKPKPIFRSRLLMYVSSPFTSRPTGSNADEWMCDRCTAATCATL